MTSPSPVDPRPIHWGEGPLGVLLLHGLTGTPYEVRPFALALQDMGLAVRAPVLAGHTDIDALERTTWRDWYESAEAAFAELRQNGQRQVVVLGLSMGSLLALRLAALHAEDVRAVIAISVPLALQPWQRHAVRTLARLRTHRWLGSLVGMRTKTGPDVRVRKEVLRSPSLPAFPYPSLAELVALQDEVTELLPRVRAPLLLLHGRYDHTAPLEGSERVAQRVASAEVRRVVLPESFHVVSLDLDRSQATREVVEFVRQMFAREPATPNERSNVS